MMQKAGVGAMTVQNSENLFADPQLKHRGHFTKFESEPGLRSYENFGFRLSGVPGYPYQPAPHLGAHSEYVCKEILSLSDEEFIQLLSEGVFE